jgi:hypothetical protein
MKDHEDLRSAISIGWLSMFVVLVFNTLTELMMSTMRGEATHWTQHHVGTEGLIASLALMPVYALMPILTRMVSGRWFKWVAVVLGAVIGLITVAHQLGDMLEGERVWYSHATFLVHHVLAVLVLVASVRWLRSGTVDGRS